jgi:hypothetical protein
MADKKFFGNDKVYVETEYDNVVVIDPNKVVNSDGTVEERNVKQENLITYANLEARVIPRTKLAIGSSYGDSVKNVGVAQLKVNFMEGNPQNQKEPNVNLGGKESEDPKYFDSSWTDQFLPGQNNKGENDIFSSGRGVDTQLLGITRINIKMNPAFVPTVTIEMTDVQGRVLFERGDKSPYSIFMNLPYPIFILTVKGHYGKAIKLELMLKDFNAQFDPSDGSYKITTSYIARSHAFLKDTLLDYLYTTPHMYPKSYELENVKGLPVDGTVAIDKVDTTKGMEKIKEVYSLYKAKGLVDDDFPEITLNQMRMRLEYFNRYVMEAYSKEDMSVLNNVVKYENNIHTYRRSFYPKTNENFWGRYIDSGSVYVLKDAKSSVLYGLNKDLDEQGRRTAISKLGIAIKEGNKLLTDNPTFYNPGNYQIEGTTYPSKISVNIKASDFIKEITDPEIIDYKATWMRRNGTEPTTTQLTKFEGDIKTAFKVASKSYKVGPDGELQETENNSVLIGFGNVNKDSNFQNGSFLAKLAKIETTFKSKRESIEVQLSEALAKKIISSDVGLGFNPTMNNVLAVICANAEAFYRLMDETHTRAWDVRDNPIRLTAIMPSEKSFGVDASKASLKTVKVDGKSPTLANSQIVYPWPQYFIEETDENNDCHYTLRYPGDPTIINTIQGWDYNVWPEIQFTEEYITASLEKDKPNISINYGNETQVSKYIGINSVEFPFNNVPYTNEEMVSFFYEMYERTYLGANYSKVVRDNNFRKTLYTVLSDFESTNIKEGVGNSPELMKILKEFQFNASTFNQYLLSISNNGQGSFFARKSRDIYTQNYIKGYVDIDFGVYSRESMSTNSVEVIASTESVKDLESYITGTSSNATTLMDVYPFNNLDWLQKNISKGKAIAEIDSANSTTGVMNFNILKKTIATFDDQSAEDNIYKNNFITYFQYEKNYPSNPNQNTSNSSDSTQYQTNAQAKDYYFNRENKDFYLTESPIDYGTDYNTATNNLTSIQTTSLLNTPYFTNALLKGVSGETNDVINPYVGLGYIYLNSLPLPTLSEKYLTRNTSDAGVNTTKWGDNIYAGLSKFAAIHKIPYLWLLKYGSIWHRYKEDKIGNGDILDGIWKDFDYVNAYDPITNDINKVYEVQNYTGGSTTYAPQTNININIFGNNIDMQFTNNGFYPKVVNDTYRFFTGKSPLITYSNTEMNDLFNNGNFKLGKSQSNFLTAGYDPSNTGRTMQYNSYYQYFDIEGNNSFDFNLSTFELLSAMGTSGNTGTTINRSKMLVIPSSGYLKFTQAQRECLNSQGKLTQNIDVNNKSIQNGNVRSLWASSHYGYYNNQWVRKPKTTQYIKVIDTGETQQDAFNIINKDNDRAYKSIEEIFAIFSKEMLDEFEKHFLNFCKKDKDYEDIVFNPSTPNDDEYLGSFNVGYDYNIEKVMKSLLLVDKPNLSDDSIKDAKSISDAQMEQFVNLNKTAIQEKDIILKIGNPGRFNRRVFDSFSSNEIFIPVDPIDFSYYREGSVPTSTNATTLVGSQGSSPEAWDELYLRVGYYDDFDLMYSDNGSFVTDFFPTMDIEFTKENVRDLSQIIKVFMTQKMKNNNLTKSDFQQTFDSYMSGQSTFQNDMLNQIFRTLNKTLPSVKVNNTQVRISKLDDKGGTMKTELWETFKNFNDRWISGQDVKNKTLFEQFLFLDKANRPIGNKVIIDINQLRGFLKSNSAQTSVLDLIGTILEKNNFIFMPTPSYSNFYGRNERVKEGMPNPAFSDVANNTFGTFLEVDTHTSEPKLLAIYVGKPSEKLNTSPENDNYLYGDDSFDLSIPSQSGVRASEDGVTNFSDRNKVVAFNVDFGIQNQSIFKSINIDMAQRKNIAPTFQILADMGAQADGQKVAQQSVSLYNFYKAASYNCSVTSMGNVMIQPTMYFNLRYVPMFYGPYLITSVTHDITTRDFQTTFEGVRMSKYSLKMPDGLVSSVNREIVQNYLSEVRRIPTLAGSTADTVTRSAKIKNSSTPSGDKTQITNNQKCVAVAKINKPYVDIMRKSITQTEFKRLIDGNGNLSDNVKKFIFGVGYVENGKGTNVASINNNHFNLKNLKENARWTIDFKEQTCVNDSDFAVPYLSFKTPKESIIFMNQVCSQYEQIIDAFLVNTTINGNLPKTFAYLWYYTFRFTTMDKELTAGSNVDDSIIASVNHDLTTNTESKQLFDTAEAVFKAKINVWNRS